VTAAADPDSPAAALSALIEELPEALRKQALTHSSWTERRVDSFERLAFLGDSVLGLSVATELIDSFPKIDSGGLTKIHNQAVSGVSCAEVGRQLGVPEMLRANEPDDVTAAIPAEVLLDGERPLPEATEALIGACYLAFGFERTAPAVAAAFAPRIELASETRIDFKSALQELLARRGARVSYEVVAATGPPHQRRFEVAAIVDSEQVGIGEGRSKKAAEQVAAERALSQLGG
jgi:ribonuclease III